MNRKPKLDKTCHYCKIHYQVSPHRRTQKFCSRECAKYSVNKYIHFRKASEKRRPLESINLENNEESKENDEKKFWMQSTGPNHHTEELRLKSRKTPFRKTSEEVAIAVRKFLNSGGKITVLPSPSIKKTELIQNPLKSIGDNDTDLELISRLSADSL
jgi:transcription termination factor Rho